MAPTSDDNARCPWSSSAEKHLLELVLTQRGGSRAKGLKGKQWSEISAVITKKHNISADGGKCRQKYTRLMAQFKVFKTLGSKSGSGFDHATCKVTLPAEAWAELIKTAKDAVTKSYIRGIQKDGFVHFELCSLLAGDSVANGEEGGDIDQVTNALCSPTQPMEAQGSDGQDHSDTEASVASEIRPPSHDLRAARVKRLRDGRKKAVDRALRRH